MCLFFVFFKLLTRILIGVFFFFLQKEGNLWFLEDNDVCFLPHFGAKPDMDSREVVKLDPRAHCCFSWDAPSLRSLFSLPHNLRNPSSHLFFGRFKIWWYRQVSLSLSLSPSLPSPTTLP